MAPSSFCPAAHRTVAPTITSAAERAHQVVAVVQHDVGRVERALDVGFLRFRDARDALLKPAAAPRARTESYVPQTLSFVPTEVHGLSASH